MALPPHPFDWTQVQAFLAVAEHGSLSAGARALGTSQPTLGRHIKSIEAALEAELFRRVPSGLELTDTGRTLLEPAQKMREAAGQIALQAAGQGDRLEGTVRITASIFTAQSAMPPIIARIRRAEPKIAIELVATDDAENLLFREADIAVRMFRPTQLEIITQHLGDLELGLYASKDYLDFAGRPKSIDDLMACDFVGYDRSERIITGMRERGIEVTRDFFKTRCDLHTVNWALVQAGCGVGFAQRNVADRDPLVEEVLSGLDIPALPVWLAAHETMRQNPRVRRVWDMLAEGLSPLLS